MVRKRSRTAATRRSYKKNYDSDENDSDSDLDLSSGSNSPAPKRYGLRQRKQPIFCQDFDYEEEDELGKSPRSEDDEYDVQEDLNEVIENHVTNSVRNFPKCTTTLGAGLAVSTIDPIEENSLEDGLIDFEDVIRADVVVNKQRVEYENVVDDPVEEPQPELQFVRYTEPVTIKGRRGRKPKLSRKNLSAPAPTDASSSSSSSTIFLQTHSVEDDTNLEVQIDPLNFVQIEDVSVSKTNGARMENITTDKMTKPIENGVVQPCKLAPSVVDDIEKYVPPVLDEKEKEIVLSNEYLLGNSFNMSADEFLENQAKKQTEVIEEEEEVPQVNFDEDSSDDDVVIIEKKPEIIVLDDD